MISLARNLGLVTLTTPVLALTLSGCFIETADESEPEDGYDYPNYTEYNYTPISLPSTALTCDPASDAAGDPSLRAGTPYCYEDDDCRWRTSCKSEGCQEVKVFTHYMLTEDLSGDYVVNVEAFDNAHFQGAPSGSVQLTNFAAKRGEWQAAQLFLEPGEYYLRAYMVEEGTSFVPYTLGGMELAADQPVGVHGALSGAEMVRVAPRTQSRVVDPVHIYLDKLFRKPGSEPETNARLRIAFSVADGVVVPDGRKVHVELRATSDLATTAVYDLEMASELFLIQGRVGHAELMSPSLAEGAYVVFAYLDANGDHMRGDDEAYAIYKVDNLVTAVAVRKDRTESIALTLAAPMAGDARE